MTPRFSVRTVPHFDRLARRLSGQHPEFPRLLARAGRDVEFVHCALRREDTYRAR